MTTRSTLISVRQAAVLLLTSLLLVGCSDSDPVSSPATQKSATEVAMSTAASTGASAPDNALPTLSSPEQNRQTEQRTAELQLELTRARTQRIHLLQKREEINARIATHQEEGMQLLASLKTQQQTSTGDDPAFEAAARSKLETALAHDTELARELELTEQELSDIEARVATLTVDLDTVRHNRTAKSDSVER
jgi:TolA-binding protein